VCESKLILLRQGFRRRSTSYAGQDGGQESLKSLKSLKERCARVSRVATDFLGRPLLRPATAHPIFYLNNSSTQAVAHFLFFSTLKNLCALSASARNTHRIRKVDALGPPETMSDPIVVELLNWAEELVEEPVC